MFMNRDVLHHTPEDAASKRVSMDGIRTALGSDPLRGLGSMRVFPFLYQPGWVAEWLCSGLQSRGRRFDSDPSLQSIREGSEENPGQHTISKSRT